MNVGGIIMHGFIAGYYKFSVWAMRLAYVNLLWIVFTILGLGIFGFMPATTGMFAVIRRWNMGDDEISIFATFWQSYKQEFIKVNILGILLFAIGYLLIVEFQILRMQESVLYQIVSFGVLVSLFIYTIVLTYFFPIFVHFNLKITDYLKWPFIIGIIHPILTVVLIGGMAVLYYIALMTVPAILFFFGGSITAFIIMWGASKSFSKYEVNEVIE